MINIWKAYFFIFAPLKIQYNIFETSKYQNIILQTSTSKNWCSNSAFFAFVYNKYFIINMFLYIFYIVYAYICIFHILYILYLVYFTQLRWDIVGPFRTKNLKHLKKHVSTRIVHTSGTFFGKNLKNIQKYI